MKHVKSIFALALVGTLSVACAAPTEEEGSGSSEEAAALDEVVETGTVSSAATADEIVVSQRTVNDSKGKPLFKVLAMRSASQGTYWARAQLATTRTLRNTGTLGAHLENIALPVGLSVTASTQKTAKVDGTARSGEPYGVRVCGSFSGGFADDPGKSETRRQCFDFDPKDPLSAPAPVEGRYYLNPGVSLQRSVVDRPLNLISSLINTAADRYAAGKPGSATYVANAGLGAYWSNAAIFDTLIQAGVLPAGKGPSFLGAALDGLNGAGQRLRVVKICDIVGVKGLSNGGALNDTASFAISNIASRGGVSLLETERFDLQMSAAPNGYPGGWGFAGFTFEWRVVKHDFVRAEVPNVSSCTAPETQAALVDMTALKP